jgi:hypothetical protein
MKNKGFRVSFNSLINSMETIGTEIPLLVWSLILILIMAAVTSAVFFNVFRHVDSTNAMLNSAAFLGLAVRFILVYWFVRAERLRVEILRAVYCFNPGFHRLRYYLHDRFGCLDGRLFDHYSCHNRDKQAHTQSRDLLSAPSRRYSMDKRLPV